MKVRTDGEEVTDEDFEALESGVTKIELDERRPNTVWVEFANGNCTSGIRYLNGSFGWDRPELIEPSTLEAVSDLFLSREEIVAELLEIREDTDG